MSSSTGIRGIRRKKSSLSEVKIAVIGAPGVGKSALTVRFLTKRYIGEYDHQSETRYKHEILVDSEPVLFEICDTCPKSATEMPLIETLTWADGFILVYSITDRNSFNYIKLVKQHIVDIRVAATMGASSSSSSNSLNNSLSTMANSSSLSVSTPLVLLGNKGDMVHLRQVAAEEGEILSKDFDCYFAEVAAADQVSEVADAFLELCREIHILRRKNKTSLLDRVLGTNKNSIRAYSRGKSDSALSKD